MPPLQIEHKIVGVELVLKHTRQPFREELVKIAFDRMMPTFIAQDEMTPLEEVGRLVVKAADAVLAAMEKTGAAEQANDVGKAAEIEKAPGRCVVCETCSHTLAMIETATGRVVPDAGMACDNCGSACTHDEFPNLSGDDDAK